MISGIKETIPVRVVNPSTGETFIHMLKAPVSRDKVTKTGDSTDKREDIHQRQVDAHLEFARMKSDYLRLAGIIAGGQALSKV